MSYSNYVKNKAKVWIRRQAQIDILRKESALEWLLKRCNEMDITEQLEFLGDATKPAEALKEYERLTKALEECGKDTP